MSTVLDNVKRSTSLTVWPGQRLHLLMVSSSQSRHSWWIRIDWHVGRRVGHET